MRSFSETLLMLLRATGTSNTTLANGCGVSRPAVNGWLSGRDPSFKNVVSICNFFQVTPNEMAGFDDLTEERIEEVKQAHVAKYGNTKRVELVPADMTDKQREEFGELMAMAREELAGEKGEDDG